MVIYRVIMTENMEAHRVHKNSYSPSFSIYKNVTLIYIYTSNPYKIDFTHSIY